MIYVNNEPVQIRERIKQNACNNIPAVQVFAVADAADLVSNGLVTNERTIAENPDLVRAMVTAFDRGLRDVINNPAEAYLLSARYVGYLATAGDEWTAALEAAADEQRAFLAESPGRKLAAERRAELLAALSERFDGSGGLLHLNVLMSTIALWDADDLGLTTLESWQATQEILLGMAFISEPIDLEQAFTNDFVPLPGDGA